MGTYAQSLGPAECAHAELRRRGTAVGAGRARFNGRSHFVGRELFLEDCATKLIDHRRVIIGGPPGVGKDAVARRLLLLREDVATVSGFHPFMPYWLLGTTVDTLQNSLRRLAVDHLGVTFDANAQFVTERVKDWLAKMPEWLLYVEDCSGEAAERLVDILPKDGRGRVLITSNEKNLPLEPTGFLRSDLGIISMEEAMELLKVKMKLKKKIEEHAGEEGPEDLTPMLQDFIRDKLQLLPLLVSCIGSLMRNFDDMGVREVISEHESLTQRELEARGRDRVNGGHLIGLVGFVRLALRKLESRLGDAQKLSRARGLLAVLAVLPFEAPGRLFRYSAEELREAWAKCCEEEVHRIIPLLRNKCRHK